MSDWLWAALITAAPFLAAGLALAALLAYAIARYTNYVCRIFQEKPLFIIPRGKPVAGAEDVRFMTSRGLMLRGCYLKTPGRRRGVVLFGLEYGSNCWACAPYCGRLLEAGYDVFAYEPRSQGESDKDPGYDPLQWVTDRDLADMRAALNYLHRRPDADPKGVGLFGISKGGSVGLLAAAADRKVRCVVTDGAYATRTTVVPYMRRWIPIYSRARLMQRFLPSWFYWVVAVVGIRRVGRSRGVRYLSLEGALGRLKRPVLMIHGGGDTYIKPQMAESLFGRLPGPKELWIVPKAKHNQALPTAEDEYHRRVIEFFDKYLAGVQEVRAEATKSDPGLSLDPPSDPGTSSDAAPRMSVAARATAGT